MDRYESVDKALVTFFLRPLQVLGFRPPQGVPAPRSGLSWI